MASFPIRKRTVVEAVTPEVEEALKAVSKELYAIPDREMRAEKFAAYRGGELLLPEDVGAAITFMIGKEDDHKVFVNDLLSRIEEFPAKDREPHDFSKDPLFCFVMSFRFDCGVDTEEMRWLTATEFRNHYRQEAHHPEWETENGVECGEMDILEMAIDRLSRNLQRNDGKFDWKQMREYLPRFTLGDNGKKQQLYLSFVDKYADMVQQAYVPRADD